MEEKKVSKPFREKTNWGKKKIIKVNRVVVPQADLHMCLSPEKRFVRHCKSSTCRQETLEAQEREIKRGY